MNFRLTIDDFRLKNSRLSRCANSGYCTSKIVNRKFPAGLTLMELLVVIFLVGLITAVTIPVMNPQAAPRRIREAARILDGALNLARNRAIAEGRSVGVWLERSSTKP